MDAAAAPLAPSPARSLAGREHRACLAHFYAGPALSAEQKLRACLEGVADRARRLSDLDAQEVRDRQRNKERTWQKHIERWEAAVHAVYLEEEGLLSGAGYRRAEQFLGASFPGDPASRTYLSEYVGMARYLSESMALTMGTSIGFLIDLSQVRDPDAIEWLWGQAQTGRPPRFVRQGVLSAITARGGGASPAEIQKAAEEGVERAETAARLLRGQGRAAAKREASKTKLLAALGGALLHLGDEVRPAAEALLRLLGRPEAPEAAEAAPAERRERPRSEPEDAPAAERVKPVATLPAPAESAAERAERAEGEKEEAGEKEEPHHAPAKRPPRRAPYQEILPVSYPHYEADYSQAERHACAALTAFAYLQLRGDRLLHMFCKEKVAVRAELQHHYCVATNRYADIRREVEERITAWAEAGRLVQEEVKKDHPDVPAEDLWPLEVRPERVRPERAMTWIFADVFDPLPKDDPSDAELELFWVLGLLEAAADHLECFLGRLDAHDEVSETLMHQLERQMYGARGPIGRLIVHFRPAMQVVEEELLLQKPEREAARARATLADAAVVVLADDRVPENLVKVATAEDGTHVALTLESAWVTVALGATGVGKSQLGVQLCEGLIMHLPGINRLTRLGVPVVFAGDWRKGRTRHQHLRGFYPNPDLRQWQTLRERFAITFGPTNAAYCRAILACLPGTAPEYRALYPDLIERGLEIRELQLHPTDWSNFGYNLMLGCADKVSGRSQYQNFVSSLRALLGDEATPERMQQEFRKSGLGGPSKHAMDAHFEFMKRLTSRDQHIDHLIRQDGVPVFAYLESRDLGAEQVLALHLAVMSALSRPLSANDPYVVYILEEVAKHGISDTLWRAYEEMTKEVRHGMRSLYLVAHLPTDVPAGVLSMASGVFQFGGTSPDGHRKLRELVGDFWNVSAQQVGDLPDRMAYGAFRRVSNQAYSRAAQLYSFRPTCIEAGGESVTRGR